MSVPESSATCMTVANKGVVFLAGWTLCRPASVSRRISYDREKIITHGITAATLQIFLSGYGSACLSAYRFRVENIDTKSHLVLFRWASLHAAYLSGKAE